MPSRTLRAAHLTDARVFALFEAVMARWATNVPLMAVGGFSYSLPGEEWRRAVQDAESFLVSSAALTGRDAAFSILFRRGPEKGAPDEISVTWNEPGAGRQGFPDEDAAALAALVEQLARPGAPALPLPPST